MYTVLPPNNNHPNVDKCGLYLEWSLLGDLVLGTRKEASVSEPLVVIGRLVVTALAKS